MTRAFKFQLVDEDQDTLLCSSLDLDGFFVERDEKAPVWRTFWLLGSAPAGVLRRFCERPDAPAGQQLGNVELRILDHSGEPIGAYFIGSATADRCVPNSTASGSLDIAVTGLLIAQPHPLAGAIWQRWRVGLPASRNAWAEYPTDGRAAWLEVVRLHSAYSNRAYSNRAYSNRAHSNRAHSNRGAYSFRGRQPDAPPGRTVELDGTQVTDPPGFYCAIGEAINGPGGYFGSSLDGLRDCLRGGYGATPPFDVVWLSHDIARQLLGQIRIDPESPETLFEAIVDILTEAGVRIVPR